MSRARLLTLAVALVIVGGVLWSRRQAILEALAAPESDYLEGWDLSRRYGRPDADLTPAWSVELQPGYGGATIHGEEAFVLDREVGVEDTLRVFDVGTGEERWRFRYEELGRLQSAGSRTSPAVNDRFVLLCSGFGQVHCVERGARRLRWRRHLEDLGGALPDFGWSASPLLFEDLVILPALGSEVGLVALDQASGEVAWRTPGLGVSQSQPVLLELLGLTQLVFLSVTEQGRGEDQPALTLISAFEPRTGTPLWSAETMLTSVPVPPPVRVDDRHIVVTGGYAGGTTLLELLRGPEGVAVEEVFHLSKGSQLHPPVVHDEHLYLLANENGNVSRLGRDQGGLRCYDLEGRELWSTGSDPYFGRGHMVVVGPYLLIQDGMSGFLRLCMASPAGYEQVLTSNVFQSPPKERKRMWGRIGEWNGTLLLRGERELVCVHLGGPPPGAVHR